MAMAISLREFFDSHPLSYEILTHKHSESSLDNAVTAHLPGNMVAKSVLLKDEDEYLLAVLPSTRRLNLGLLHQLLNRHVGLATQDEVASVFSDCEIGVIPPTGLLYDINTFVDEALLAQSDIYFEAGDHEHLVHMDREGFGKLMGDATSMKLS